MASGVIRLRPVFSNDECVVKETTVRINKLLTFGLACGLCVSVGSAQAEAEQDLAAAQAVQNTTASTQEAAVSETTQASDNAETTAQTTANEPTAAPETQSETTEADGPQRDEFGFYIGGPAYISDNNKVWTRSGPGEGYRVTGSRIIGDKLKLLRYSDNRRWAQIEYEGDTNWILLESLTPEMCGRPLVDKLNAEIKELNYRLDNYDNELMQRTKTAEAEVARLTKLTSELKVAIANKDATINELDELYRDYADRLETKDLDMQMRWWMQGAIIALCGALAGVIFVFLPRPTRKQKRDRY